MAFSFPQNFTDINDITTGAFDPMRGYLQKTLDKRTPAENRMYGTNNLLAPVRSNAYPTVFAQTPEAFGQGMSQTADQATQFWQQLLQQAGGDANKAIESARPYLQQIGGLAEAIGSYYGNKELQANLESASQQADPFGSQRGGYQEQLRNTTTNPNWMQENSTLNPLTNDQYIQDYANKDLMGNLGNENYLQSISDRVQNDVAKQMSAKGFMNSGNYGMELGQRLQQEIAPLSLQQQQAMAGIRQNQAGNILNAQQQRQKDLVGAGQNQQTFLSNLSGAQFGPGQSANISADAARAGSNARTGASAGIGYSLQQQPNYPQDLSPQWRSMGASSRPTGFGGIEYGP